MKDDDIKTIIQLLERGFNPKIISFELDIPLDYITECQKQYEKRRKTIESKTTTKIRKKTRSALEIIREENENAHKKMNSMKERYNTLVNKDEFENKDVKVFSKEDEEEINYSIKQIEEYLLNFDNLSTREREKNIKKVIKELYKTEKLNLNMSQAEKIVKIINSIKKDTKYDEKTNWELTNKKQKYFNLLAKIIDDEATKSNNIEVLKNLYKKLPSNGFLLAGSVKSKIFNKIARLQRTLSIQNSNKELKNNKELNFILTNILSDDFHYEKIMDILEKEAVKAKEKGTSNKFELTLEEEKERIIKRINHILSNQSEEYPITNIEKTICNLNKLNKETNSTITTVIENLNSRGKFDLARETLNEYKKEYKIDSQFLEKQIVIAEIRDTILNELNENRTPEEEKFFFRKLERQLTENKITPNQIRLGKSKDGLYTITLDKLIDFEEKVK